VFPVEQQLKFCILFTKKKIHASKVIEENSNFTSASTSTIPATTAGLPDKPEADLGSPLLHLHHVTGSLHFMLP
jgi:hypothetical protein